MALDRQGPAAAATVNAAKCEEKSKKSENVERTVVSPYGIGLINVTDL